MQDLVKACYRMPLDRLIVSDLNSGAAWDYLNLLSTGIDAGIATMNAPSGQMVIKRLLNLCMQAGYGLPQDMIPTYIEENTDLIIHIAKLKDGSHKITEILQVSEIDETKNEVVATTLFAFDGKNGRLYRTEKQMRARLIKKMKLNLK